jgi:hypothetical protein
MKNLFASRALWSLALLAASCTPAAPPTATGSSATVEPELTVPPQTEPDMTPADPGLAPDAPAQSLENSAEAPPAEEKPAN